MMISLIGYRGTGKSSVAPALAQRLGWDWVDADVVLEREAGKTIREIFAIEGEPGFRSREASLIARLLGGKQTIVAAGGGAILNLETRRQMKAAGPVVWLKAGIETILERIQADQTTADRRPRLTAEADLRSEVSRLLEIRTPLYLETSTIVVETDGLSIAEIVDQVWKQAPVEVRAGRD
jgi:shikimate kinase